MLRSSIQHRFGHNSCVLSLGDRVHTPETNADMRKRAHAHSIVILNMPATFSPLRQGATCASFNPKVPARARAFLIRT